MFVGIGVGIGRNRFAQGIFNAYNARVVADGGITEAGNCVNAVTGLLLNASLLIIPSGYKGGKAYAEIPTNGNGDLTWTRASDAWRTNSDGLIQRVPWNLLLNTNTFSGWSLEGGALTSGFTAPDGTSTAYKYVQTTGGLYSGSSTATSGSKTASIWLKSVSGTSITCNLQDGGSGNNTVVTVTGDWQLFTATYTTSTSRPSLYVWGISNASGIYVWHPQLVEGTTAQTYLPTTDRLNFPRLSYMYGSCPSALLEPQRTNVNTKSNDFTIGGGFWYDFNGKTPVANQGTSPDGTNNAWSIPVGSLLGTEFGKGIGGTIGDKTAASIWAKGNETAFRLYIQNVTNTDIIGTVTVNLTTGAITSGSGTVQSFNNGWYRITTIGTSTITNGSPRTIMSNPNSSCLIYGSQFEAGAYPTTYIPTTSATATRVADSAVKTGISSLIGQTSGSVFVEFISPFLESYTQRILTLSDGTNTNVIGFQLSSANQLIFYVESGGVNQVAITKTSPSITLGSNVKIAAAYANNDFVFYVNGTQIGTDTSGSVPATSQLRFSEGNGTAFYYGQIKQVALFDTRLTNSQLASLTT